MLAWPLTSVYTTCVCREQESSSKDKPVQCVTRVVRTMHDMPLTFTERTMMAFVNVGCGTCDAYHDPDHPQACCAAPGRQALCTP
jgi:hypothetical protein